MRIAVTDTLGSEHKFQKYIEWLGSGGIPVKCMKTSYRLDNNTDGCDALVLTGGHDVDPLLYGGPMNHPTIVDVDRRRDDFERNVLTQALDRRIPILGICRGLQLANVHFGGTLIADIQEAGYPAHRSESDDHRHGVSIADDSLLHSIAAVTEGIINSRHHQAVDRTAPDLKIVARSTDGIIEALELAVPAGYPFFLLVQWHPERMSDRDNPLSAKILECFLSSIQKEITQSIGNEE